MKRSFRYAPAALCALLLTLFILYARGDIGIPQSRIAADAQRDLPGGEILSDACGEELAALLLADGGEPSLRIYVDRPGLSFGWFFRYGGPPGAQVTRYRLENCGEVVYAAGSGHGMCAMAVDDGTGAAVTPLDPDSPFVLVLPANAGTVVFYDEAGRTGAVLDRSM